MAEQDIRTWALKGAEQRLVEIAEEAAQIYATFPELRDRGAGVALPSPARRGRPRKDQTAGGEDQPRRRRRKMSREARKRISEAQKARWAKQRAPKAR